MPMNLRPLLALSLLVSVAACGDEETTTPVGDAGTDIADVGQDAMEDAGADAAEDTVAADPLETLHAEIITPSCGGLACHLSGQSLGGINLDLDDTLLDRLLGPSSVDGIALVEPGSAEDSYFYLKLTGDYLDVGGSGSLMPLGTTGLSQDQLDQVAAWIDGLEVE